jgi:signal transduction histidine kinase
LDFGRTQMTVSLTEIVLIVALFSLGPIGVAISGAAGHGASRVARRVPPLKVLFNTANYLCACMVAASGFWLVGSRSIHDLAGWAAALAATLCFSIINLASIAAVLALVEKRRMHDMFLRSAPLSVLVTLAAAPLGLVGLDLFHRATWGPLLLAPLAVAVGLNTRYAALQRDEHLRFERLYEAASRTSRLLGFDEAVEAVAREARSLLTGAYAVCCAKSSTDAWVGVLVGEEGSVVASAELVETVRRLSFGRQGQEMPLASMAPAVQRALPRTESVVLALSPEESVVPLVLAVFRRGASEGLAAGHVETLSAFATQASLAVANGQLYAEVEDAFRHQVDLNRQKSDFVAAVSHELRTPLTTMLGSVQTLQRLGARADDERREQLLEMTARQGKRLKRLIEELLLVAASEQSGIKCKQDPVDVAALLREVCAELTPPTARRVSLSLPPQIATVVTDRLMLQQVLFNLVENASKYAPEGPIEVGAVSVGANIVLSVRDYGPGIPAGQRNQVFERFVQLDQSTTRRSGGTGLGLYLSRQLATALGGELQLAASDGPGCCFTLTLPAASGPAPTGPDRRFAERPHDITLMEAPR